MIDEGVPVDGVGFKGHLYVGTIPDPEGFGENLQRYIDLVLVVSFNKVNTHIPGEKNSSSIAQQDKDFDAVLEVNRKLCRRYVMDGVTYTPIFQL